MNLLSLNKTLIFLLLAMASITLPAQQSEDSTYLPRIHITSANGYGPYWINTKRTNVFIVDSLPVNTSRVVMRFIDSKGGQLGDAYVKEGTDILDAVWVVESEDVGFVLSPHLSVEVTYKTDSNAIYRIPYVVYPDTVRFHASAGWGPMITNDYPFSDTSWHPVPPLYNDFTVTNLPPRTDSVTFQLLASDSTVIKSHLIHAQPGEYLDSATYLQVRMDSLPLSTRYLQTLIRCEGGPDGGLVFHHELLALPQKPRLISIVDKVMHLDSIPPFEEHQYTGQTLQIDSAKHAEIRNGPGEWDRDRDLEPIYPGPYSLDILQRDFTIEAWMQYNQSSAPDTLSGMSLMSVESVWEIRMDCYSDVVWLTIRSLADSVNNELFTAYVPKWVFEEKAWHHLAFTLQESTTNELKYHFYLDGKEWDSTSFYSGNYWRIREDINYEKFRGTQPLVLGVNPSVYASPMRTHVVAMDEVRIWQGALYPDQIMESYNKKVLQEEGLYGYWDFDDRRNHLGIISDLSYKNNTGILKNGAAFIPQHLAIHESIDTLIFLSGNNLADTLIWDFIDRDQLKVFSDTSFLHHGGDTLYLDMSILPHTIEKLQLRYFYPGCQDSGFITGIPLQCYAPRPEATPRFNWNTYYWSMDSLGVFRNYITLSGLPDHTSQVALGLRKDDEYFNVDTARENSVPYRYFLDLNGTDNYITTNHSVAVPGEFSASFWFRTTSNKGGRIFGLADPGANAVTGNDPMELILEKDGSLRFYLQTEEDSVYVLEGAHAYNDGLWHVVRLRYRELLYMEMYVDSCLIARGYLDNFVKDITGSWVIGKAGTKRLSGDNRIAEYLQGSICEFRLRDSYRQAGSSYDRGGWELYFPFDDGSGDKVRDGAGANDGTLKGSSKGWFTSGTLSFVTWEHNIIDKGPGTYTFFADLIYDDGPAEGARYDLGRMIIQPPFPEHNFAYNMEHGFGFFNEGTFLDNTLDFWISYTNSDSADWKENFLQYKIYTLDHYLVSEGIYTYTEEYNEDIMVFDVGDAPPGSYLSLEVGYHTTDNKKYITDQISFPLYINQMIPPIVSGNFGPFDQAIAPGCMVQENTFIITTEILSDLNDVKARFRDKGGNEIAFEQATQIDDTTWHVTHDMGTLSPPVTTLTLEYYLGTDPRPALVQGPFPITIHKTRPRFFDFLADTSFHNVTEQGDSVTFYIITPNEKSQVANILIDVTMPLWVPLIGGSGTRLFSPTTKAHLKYIKPTYTLALDQTPVFYQKAYTLGANEKARVFSFDFNASQSNTYGLDAKNDLIATQNFAIGGDLAVTSLKIDDLGRKTTELLKIANVFDVESIIIKPSFLIRVKGGFEYASRLNLMTDTVNGGWGSRGNLDVDANPEHTEAYRNSSSYHFYSASLEIDFDLGVKFLEGLVSGYTSIDGRVAVGFGHSYVTIPHYDSKMLKSGAIQMYGKFYIKVLWGWYEKTLWGPQLFVSHNFWNGNMTNCFPPLKKDAAGTPGIPANSSWQALVDEIVPVSSLSRMPVPVPEPHIVSNGDHKLFTWIERGKTYGERGIFSRYLGQKQKTFSERTVIALNNNALNNPVAEAVSDNLGFYAWAQTRHDNESILAVRAEDMLYEFVKGQDIWACVYDLEKDSLLFQGAIEDDMSGMTSGRAEANPRLASLSGSKAMIVWQSADLVEHRSEIWYALLEDQGGSWVIGAPQLLASPQGAATDLQVVTTESDKAMVAWLNSDRMDTQHNSIMASHWNGEGWSPPETILDNPGEYYNYFDMKVQDSYGGLLVSCFIEDSQVNQYEKLLLVPWDGMNSTFLPENLVELLVDTVHHIQLPELTIDDDGAAVILFKREEMVGKEAGNRISQLDLLVGDLDNISGPWTLIPAHPFVCDTLKQVDDLQIIFTGKDTLMILSNEYPLSVTNVAYKPLNGVFFGDPYMNLVLRSFALGDDDQVVDIPEGHYFTALPEFEATRPAPKLYQNYPNPCNEGTTIVFDQVEPGRLKMELFDINGIHIATLLDNSLSAGRYEMSINTSLLKPGIYIYTLTRDEVVSSLRMVVAR